VVILIITLSSLSSLSRQTKAIVDRSVRATIAAVESAIRCALEATDSAARKRSSFSASSANSVAGVLRFLSACKPFFTGLARPALQPKKRQQCICKADSN
jgi:hypothetical protein